MSTMKSQLDENPKSVNEPLWMVPIGRNPTFVGRNGVLSTLNAKLSNVPHAVSTAVLCGLGGVG